jgi:cellulose synthase/poly-beta-1,6-N-acetylglucosamine synthase-like glycosyltransferase
MLSSLSTFDLAISILFVAATAVQLFFWFYFFSRLVFSVRSPESSVFSPSSPLIPHPSPLTPSPLPVSIIICARNESDNLRKNLNRFLNQTYRSFEVIVVNHKSSDETSNVLKSLQREYKNLRVVECDDTRIGKKYALAKGIEQATHHVLLLTDADCVPASDHWISGMTAGMEDENTQIVLGVAPYTEYPGPLNKFIRFEACYTAMQYLSFALAGFPYMGVGRNLAYRRELFELTGGFRRHEHLASGDDDLFVNEAARKGHVGIRLNPDAFVFSEPKTTWRAYYRQKTRHFSTGRHYKLHHKVLLSLLAMSHWLHYTGGLIVALKISIIFALLGYAVRMIVVMAFSSVILGRLQHRSLRPFVPALDAALVLFYMAFTPGILMNTNTQRWN